MKIVVVGSGIAGLIAALQLVDRHDVTLVTKAHLEDSNTRWAQGGVAAAMFTDDSVAEHIADTLRAGAGLCDAAAVEVLCAEGPARVRDLIRLGVPFDRERGAADGELSRGLEAAHSRARILHAGGDSTGLAIETALVRAVRATGVTVLEHTFARDLVLREGRVAGLEIINAEFESVVLDADAVILASGGAGQMFRYTTNPAVATGDGIAIALRAGAQISDVEFYQFHPTALIGEGTFLISEALRGEGAVLLDAAGRRFMQALHPDAELAPRDVVARCIARQMAAQNGEPVRLDATAMGPEFLATRFPAIDRACRARGLDWSSQPIPVTPAAHYWMGGIRTDHFGRTSVAGLFAVGEAACTGVHGANRLASNSLLESLVFAWRCAGLLDNCNRATELHAADFSSDTAPLNFIAAPDASNNAREIVDRAALQQLMWDDAGIERSAEGLELAARTLAQWRGSDASVHDLETANLLDLARVFIAAALARCESRGAHFRLDYPETLPSFAHSLHFSTRAAREISANNVLEVQAASC